MRLSDVHYLGLPSNKTFREVQYIERSEGASSGGTDRGVDRDLKVHPPLLRQPLSICLYPRAPRKAEDKGYLALVELDDLQGLRLHHF